MRKALFYCILVAILLSLSGMVAVAQSTTEGTAGRRGATEEAVSEATEKVMQDREVVQTYTVQWGDTLVTIAQNTWGDHRLWPDLYAMNKDTIENPFVILPGMELEVFERIGKGGQLSEAELTFLLSSFGEVYKQFVSLGKDYVMPRRWILSQASYFDYDFVETFSAQIEQSDLEWYRNLPGME
jgi:hypothetical protein